MKKLLVLIAPIFLFFACDEIPPNVGMGTIVDPPVTGETVQKVLIEEFTGVRCVNCPAGSEAIEQLIGIHGDRLVAVSIHAGFFSVPYDESKYDLKIEEGGSLISFLGEPLGFPTAVVSRKLFEGELELQLGRAKWAGLIDQELARTPSIKMDLNPSYNAGSRNLDLSIDVQYLEPIADAQPKLTLMVTESNIKDYQLTPEGKISDYSHKHVLRDVLTAFTGDNIDSSPAGNMLTKDYSYTIPNDWDEDEISIVAFVHNSTDNKEIIQVESVKLK